MKRRQERSLSTGRSPDLQVQAATVSCFTALATVSRDRTLARPRACSVTCHQTAGRDCPSSSSFTHRSGDQPGLGHEEGAARGVK